MPYSIKIIRELEELDPKLRVVFLAILEEIERNVKETVKKSDFDELKQIVARLGEKVEELAEAQKLTEQRVNELAEAQKRTEQSVNELTEAQKKSEERLSRLEIAVAELTEAQKKSEERLSRLEIAVAELTEAHKKSEERLTRLEIAVAELTEAQKKSEERLTRLEIAVAELTEAQKKSEERITRLEITVQELAEAQRRTEKRLEELAQAQRKTEERVDKLAEAIEKLTKSHYELRQEVGTLAHTVGYRLEDEAFKALPNLLMRDLGIEIKGRFKRDFIEIAPNKYMEVNIFGYGRLNGKEYLIVGEAKSQLKKKDVDMFIKKADSIMNYISKEQIRVLVTYIASPQVQKYVRDNKINLYFSYDF